MTRSMIECSICTRNFKSTGAEICGYCAEYDHPEEKIAFLESECDRFRAALSEYGHHKHGCNCETTGCDCGILEILWS